MFPRRFLSPKCKLDTAKGRGNSPSVPLLAYGRYAAVLGVRKNACPLRGDHASPSGDRSPADESFWVVSWSTHSALGREKHLSLP
jgi:hypothetical protein